jgi:hypothetical protein
MASMNMFVIRERLYAYPVHHIWRIHYTKVNLGRKIILIRWINTVNNRMQNRCHSIPVSYSEGLEFESGSGDPLSRFMFLTVFPIHPTQINSGTGPWIKPQPSSVISLPIHYSLTAVPFWLLSYEQHCWINNRQKKLHGIETYRIWSTRTANNTTGSGFCGLYKE